MHNLEADVYCDIIDFDMLCVGTQASKCSKPVMVKRPGHSPAREFYSLGAISVQRLPFLLGWTWMFIFDQRQKSE